VRASRLLGAELDSARLVRPQLRDCELREAELAETAGDSARFAGCDLSGATFRGARFAASELRGCTLDGVAGVQGLRGSALPWQDLVGLAGTMAAALWSGMLEEEPGT
jgi:uncharacterized protein YjbI with pentapeptide repeats